MRDPDRVDGAGPRLPAVLNLTAATSDDGLMLVDVEGELDALALTRWSGLLDSAVTGGATGIAVDLRGCSSIDIGCLSVLVAASGKLKERGDEGIRLVITPESLLRRRVQATGAKRLSAYSSAGEALRSPRDAP